MGVITSLPSGKLKDSTPIYNAEEPELRKDKNLCQIV